MNGGPSRSIKEATSFLGQPTLGGNKRKEGEDDHLLIEQSAKTNFRRSPSISGKACSSNRSEGRSTIKIKILFPSSLPREVFLVTYRVWVFGVDKKISVHISSRVELIVCSNFITD
ncbi:hypothetical protein JTE90_002320 [Oedothorax gibbosus]|uniref:Uncharacterized protein n=1 Tax=Oedothorax gibbosus TaxID=931172 RepID=A0AAV6UL35_9ARAC|nr:hypothetical protein JTE90_002320 [Oedothorax gibbosus]